MQPLDARLQVAAVVLSEELNFSRAAERLAISQPALSKQIAELEKLFEQFRRLLNVVDALAHEISPGRNRPATVGGRGIGVGDAPYGKHGRFRRAHPVDTSGCSRCCLPDTNRADASCRGENV